jgi:hypothetical protein
VFGFCPERHSPSHDRALPRSQVAKPSGSSRDYSYAKDDFKDASLISGLFSATSHAAHDVGSNATTMCSIACARTESHIDSPHHARLRRPARSSAFTKLEKRVPRPSDRWTTTDSDDVDLPV